MLLSKSVHPEKKKIRILGTRGVPANHGGFETFAEQLALFLVRRGWDVTVYCQEDDGAEVYEDAWEGVRRVHIPVSQAGALGTIVFDWKSHLHAGKSSGLILTLGYNTAVFSLWFRLKGLNNVINMDGIEWKRQKWGLLAKIWFYLNEWAGAWLGNHLVADHPAIKVHLSSRVSGDKITTIAYGAHEVTNANVKLLEQYNLSPSSYAILIARAEPENSILEVVRAWSRKPRGIKLAILGRYEVTHSYQRMVKEAASSEVVFLGPIYATENVSALRFFARLYIHGHQVGGTNPSLVEALGAGNPVLAHDNQFNRWVAGNKSQFFGDERECATVLDELLDDEDVLSEMSKASIERFHEAFTWGKILEQYENLLAPQA